MMKKLITGWTACLHFAITALAADAPPNFIFVYTDNLGYGDIACFGHPTHRTPNLDRMVAEGMKLTHF